MDYADKNKYKNQNMDTKNYDTRNVLGTLLNEYHWKVEKLISQRDKNIASKHIVIFWKEAYGIELNNLNMPKKHLQ